MTSPNFDPLYSTDNIWLKADEDTCLSDHLDEMASDIESKAPASHTHSGYAPADHTHTGFAASDHTHEGYAGSSHTHTPASIGAAPASHSHDYAAPAHSHDQSDIDGLATALNGKAAADHSHTGYAAASHSHSYNDLTNKPTIPSAYSHPASHPASMITGLAKVATSGSYSDLSNKPTIPTIPASLPANGGNADTVDGKHASDFAAASHTHSYAASSHSHSAATTSAAGFMSASDKSKLDGIASGANKTTVDSALSSTSTNPVQNKVIDSALAGKAASNHTHSGYFSTSGGTISGETNVNGVLRVNGQQSFYFQTSTMSQTVGTNNATGGTTICCGSSANVVTNGANLMTPNCLPKATNTYYCGNTNFRWKGIYSNAAVNVSSDERLKKNIVPMDADPLARFIEALNVVSYNYKDDEEGRKARIGLVAQDVQRADAKLADFFVSEDESGMLGLTPADLVFPLIAAVQELSKRVRELESKA